LKEVAEGKPKKATAFLILKDKTFNPSLIQESLKSLREHIEKEYKGINEKTYLPTVTIFEYGLEVRLTAEVEGRIADD